VGGETDRECPAPTPARLPIGTGDDGGYGAFSGIPELVLVAVPVWAEKVLGWLLSVNAGRVDALEEVEVRDC
jgi:hypothetical protein